MKQGYFITFEGGDGAGKSTQINILKDELTAAGYDVILTREPGPELSRIHDRMPLIMPPEAAVDWILPQTKAEDLIQYSLTGMEIRATH